MPENSLCNNIFGVRLPLTGAEIPKIGKRGFRSQKTPISHYPRKGCSKSKNPHFPCSALYRNGDFLARNTLFWGGKWGLFGSEALFSRFCRFRPCKGANKFLNNICTMYSCIVDTPNIFLGDFLLFAEQHRLEENYLTYHSKSLDYDINSPRIF